MAGGKALAAYLVGDYRTAARWYRIDLDGRDATVDPDDPGWRALIRGDRVEAKLRSERAIANDPQTIAARLTLAELALDDDSFVTAIGHAYDVLTLRPDSVDAHLLSALARIGQGSPGEAIDAVNKALRTGRVESRPTTWLRVLDAIASLEDPPARDRSNCLLAHWYRYLRIFDGHAGSLSERYARRAIDGDDRPADAHFTLGVLEEKRGRLERALDAFRRAIELNPQHAEAYRWSAFVYGKRGDLIREYEMAKAALDAAPRDGFYVTHIDHVLTEKLGDVRQAIALFEGVLVVNADNVRAWDRLGYLYGFIGDHDRAVTAYRRALELEPDNSQLHRGLGWSLDRTGRSDEAIEAYERAMQLAPGDSWVYTALANVQYGRGNTERAIALYEQAVALGLDDADARAQLCSLYHLVSAFAKAVRCFEEVLVLDPTQALANRLLPESRHNATLQRKTS
jgi:tetratricopeptide (TPR) repeat protein